MGSILYCSSHSYTSHVDINPLCLAYEKPVSNWEMLLEQYIILSPRHIIFFVGVFFFLVTWMYCTYYSICRVVNVLIELCNVHKCVPPHRKVPLGRWGLRRLWKFNVQETPLLRNHQIKKHHLQSGSFSCPSTQITSVYDTKFVLSGWRCFFLTVSIL